MSKLLVMAATPVVVAALTACGTGAVGQLGELQQLAKTCPKGKTVSAFVALSVSGNQRGPQLTAARMAAVKSAARLVAVCGGGELKVTAFGPSVASTAIVYENQLKPAGATLNARLLRVPRLVDHAVTDVEATLPAAFKRLTPEGTDPIGQLQLAREFIDAQDADVQSNVLIETAGLAPQLLTRSLTAEVGRELAANVDVPALPTATLTVAGLGHVGSGAHPSTTTVEGLIAFYDTVCKRTGALVCRATTDIAVGS